jgi:hypothetical protein
MTDSHDLRATLTHFAENIDKWRAEAARLRAETEGKRGVATELLVHVEDTSGDVYREIQAFNTAVAEVSKQSPQAAGELAEVGEALHLLLLDFTELGTKLYSTRSQAPKRRRQRQ